MFISQLSLEQEVEELYTHTIMGHRAEIEQSMIKWSIENRHLINTQRFENISGGNPGLLSLTNEDLKNQPELEKELEQRLSVYVQSRFMSIYNSMKNYGLLDYVAGLKTTKDKEDAFIIVYSKGNKGLEELAEYKKQNIDTFQKPEEKKQEEEKKLGEIIPHKTDENTKYFEVPLDTIYEYPINWGKTPFSLIFNSNENKFDSFNKIQNYDIKKNIEEIEEEISNVYGGWNINASLNISNHKFELKDEELEFELPNGENIKIKKNDGFLELTYKNNQISIYPTGEIVNIRFEEFSLSMIVYDDLSFNILDTILTLDVDQGIGHNEEDIELITDIKSFEALNITTEDPFENKISITSGTLYLEGLGKATICFDVYLKNDETGAGFLDYAIMNSDPEKLFQELKRLINSKDVTIRNLNMTLDIKAENEQIQLQISNGERYIYENEDIKKITINGDLSLTYLGIKLEDMEIHIEDISSQGTKSGELLKQFRLYSTNTGIDLIFKGQDIDFGTSLLNKETIIKLITSDGFEGRIYFDKISEVLKSEERAVFQELYKIFPNGITLKGSEVKLILDIIDGKENIKQIEELKVIQDNNINIQEILDKTIREVAKTTAYSIKSFAPRAELFGDKGIWRGGIGAMEYSNRGIGMTGGIYNFNMNLGRSFSAHIGTSLYELNVDYAPITAVDISITTQSISASPYIFLESSPKFGNFELNLFAFGSYNLFDIGNLINKKNKLKMGINIAEKKLLEDIPTVSSNKLMGYGEGNIKYEINKESKIGIGAEITPTYNYKTGDYGIMTSPYLSLDLQNNTKIKLTQVGKEYDLSFETKPSSRAYINFDLRTSNEATILNSNIYYAAGEKFSSVKLKLFLETGVRERLWYQTGLVGISSGPFSVNFGLNKQKEWELGMGLDIFSIINWLTPDY